MAPPDSPQSVSVQYDVSPKEKELILKRAQMREALRKEYQKKIGDPNRYASQERYLFDPAIQRFTAMRASRYHHFRPTYKGFFSYLTVTFIPIGLCAYFLHSQRSVLEKKYRQGEIAYKDRRFKFS